jgi:hypothetical protein
MAESYIPPVKIGEEMRAGGIGTVTKTAGEGVGNLKAGDLVCGILGKSMR